MSLSASTRNMPLLTVYQVDLFPAEAPGNFKRPQRRIAYNLPDERTQDGSDRLSNDWTESERYHRVCKIGQGAFATVYKVTDKFHGIPYAAKELDKRKFMKNGVLDQKVENEMNIMQRIKHVSHARPLLPPISTDRIASQILSDT